MSAIQGTYKSTTPGISELVISSADDSNGQLSGILTVYPGAEGVDQVTLNITGHYHYQNSVGPGVSMWIGGWDDGPNLYVGMALTGTASGGSFNLLLGTGGMVISNDSGGDAFPWTGTFNKE